MADKKTTLLLRALENGNLKSAERLLKKGADLNATFDGVPALFKAYGIDLKHDNFNATSFFIDNGADLNIKDKDGNTLLLVSLDLNYFGNSDSQDKRLETIIRILKFLYRKIATDKNVNFNAVGKDGRSFVSKLSTSAIINKKSPARLYCLVLLSTLLKNGASANIPSRGGKLPLYAAVTGKDFLLAEILAPYTLQNTNYIVENGKLENDRFWTWQMLGGNQIGTAETFVVLDKFRNTILLKLANEETKTPYTTDRTNRDLALFQELFGKLQPEQKWVDKDHERYLAYINQANTYGKEVEEQFHTLAPQANIPTLRLEALEATKVGPDGNGK